MSARIAVGVLAVAAAAAAAIALLRSGPETSGDFDYYTLALSWSPTWCQTEGRSEGARQCEGRPRAFVLHGLWPQHERGWPDSCYSGERPWVPERVIDNMIDIMPGKGLIIHQYAKHGTCSGLPPEDYFDAARKAFDSVRVPKRFQRLDRPLEVTPEEVESAFLKENPALRADMLSVTCGPKRLREVRICFSKDLEPTACGPNEDQARLCRRPRVRVPPVQ
ncbi:MAG: ribonuclease T2 family protein [Dichotomicrobium sp.]